MNDVYFSRNSNAFGITEQSASLNVEAWLSSEQLAKQQQSGGSHVVLFRFVGTSHERSKQ
jgi:hypothetical protein